MSRKTTERMMDRESDGDREKLVSVLCTTAPAYTLEVISIYNEKRNMLVTTATDKNHF